MNLKFLAAISPHGQKRLVISSVLPFDLGLLWLLLAADGKCVVVRGVEGGRAHKCPGLLWTVL